MCFLACDLKCENSTMVLLPLLPTGSSSPVVLGLPWNSANLLFMYLTTTVSSFSASILVLDELVPCEYHCSLVCNAVLCVPVRSILRTIDRPCSSMLRTSFVLDSDSSSLVGIDTSYKIAPPLYHRSRWVSCSVCANALLLHGSADSTVRSDSCSSSWSTLSSVNVGQTL